MGGLLATLSLSHLVEFAAGYPALTANVTNEGVKPRIMTTWSTSRSYRVAGVSPVVNDCIILHSVWVIQHNDNKYGCPTYIHSTSKQWKNKSNCHWLRWISFVVIQRTWMFVFFGERVNLVWIIVIIIF